MKMRKTELLKEAEEKNRLLHRQYEILQKNYAANAQLFHDMNHHLQVIYHLAERGENEKIRAYIAHAAVSYTHLDVYKRQGSHRPFQIP